MDCSFKPEPMIGDHQLIGDSQLLRLSEQFLNGRRCNNRQGLCVSGQTILELYTAIQKRTYPVSPKIICMIGTNDLTRNSSIESMIDNMNSLVNLLLKERQVQKLILLTAPPVPKLAKVKSHWKCLKIFNNHIASLANGSNISVLEIDQLFLANHDSSPSYDDAPCHFPRQVPLPYPNRYGPFSQERESFPPDFSRPPPCNPFQLRPSERNKRPTGPSLPTFCSSNSSLNQEKAEDLLCPQLLKTYSRSSVAAPEPEMKPRVLEDMWDVESIKPKSFVDSKASTANAIGDGSQDSEKSKDPSLETWPAQQEPPKTEMDDELTAPASSSSPVRVDARDNSSNRDSEISSLPLHDSATGDMENLKIKDSQPVTQSPRQKPIGADSPTLPVSTTVHSKNNEQNPDKTVKNSFPNKPKAFEKKLKSPLIKESKQEDQCPCVKNETDCEPEDNWDNEILGHGTKIPNKTSSQNLEDIDNQCYITNQKDEKTVKLNESLRAGSQKPVVIPSKKDSGRQEGNLKSVKHRTCLNVIWDHIKDNSPLKKLTSNASASSKVVMTSSEATASSVNSCSPAQSDSSGDSYVSTPKVLKVNETDVSSAKFNQKNRAVGQQGNSRANKYMSSRGRGDRPLRKVPARNAASTPFPPCERKLLNKFEPPGDQCFPQNSSRSLRQLAFEDAGDSVMECEQFDSCEMMNQGDNGYKSNLGNTSDSSFLQEQVGPSGNQTFSGDASKTMQVTESSTKNQSRLGDYVSKSINESFYPGNNILTNDESESNAPEQKVPGSAHLDCRLTQNSEGINEDGGNVLVPNVGKFLQQRVVVDDSSSNANYCRPTMHERKPQTVSSELSESTNPKPNQVLTEESNALPQWFPSNDAQPIPMTAALLMQVSDNNERSRVYFPGHTEIQGGNYVQQDSHRANHPANFESGWKPAAYPYSENRYSGVSAQFREQIYQPVNVSNLPHHQSNQNDVFMENQRFENETIDQLQTQSLNDDKFFNQQPYYGNQEKVLTAVTTTFNMQYQQAQNFPPAFCNSMQDHMNMHLEKFPSIPDPRLRPAAPYFEPIAGIRGGNFYGPPTFHDSRAAESVQHLSQRALPEPPMQRKLVKEISESNFNYLEWGISGAQANLPPEHSKSQFYSRGRRRGNDHKNYNCRSHQEVTARALEHRDFLHQIPQKPELLNDRPPQTCPAQPEEASKTARYVCQVLKNVRNTLEKAFQYSNLENVQAEKPAIHSDLDIVLSYAIKLKEAVEKGNFETTIMKEECEKEALIFASHFVGLEDKDSKSIFENDQNHILEQEPKYQDNMDRVGRSADNEKNEVPKTWSHECHENLHLGELNKQVTSFEQVERSEIEKPGKSSNEKSYNNGQRNKLPEPCDDMGRSTSFKDNELPLHQKDGREAPKNESLEHYNSMSRPQNYKDMQVLSIKEFDENVPTNKLVVLSETLGETKGIEDSAEACQLQPTANVPIKETFKDSTKMEQSKGHEHFKVGLHQNFENFSPNCEHLKHSEMTEKPMSQGNKKVVQHQKSGCRSPENSSNMRKPESKADNVDKENQKFAISPRSEPVQYHEKIKKIESDRDDKVTTHRKSNKLTPKNAASERYDERRKHENLEDTMSATGRKNHYHGGRNQANSSNIGRDLTLKEDSVIPYQKSNKSKSEIQRTRGHSAREHSNVSHKNRYFKRTKNEQLTEGKMQSKVESEGPRSPPEGNEKDRINNDLKQRDFELTEGCNYPKKSESQKNSELSVETTQHPLQADENTEHVSPTETQYLNIAGNQLVADWEELDEFQKSPHDKIHNEQFSKNPMNIEGRTTDSPVSDKQRNQSSLDDGKQQCSTPLISHAPQIPFEECQQSENTGMFKYQESCQSGFWKIPEAAKASKSYIDSIKAGSATSSNTYDRAFMASKNTNKDEVLDEMKRSLQYNQENQRVFEKSDMQDFKHPGQWSDSHANRPSNRYWPQKTRDVGAESTNWRSQQRNNQMWYSSSSEEEFPAMGARRSRRGRQRMNEAHDQRSNFTMPVRSYSAEGFPRMRFLSPPVPTQTRHFPDHDFSKIKMDNFELFFGSSYENPSPRQDLIHLNKKGLGMVFNLIKEKLSKEES